MIASIRSEVQTLPIASSVRRCLGIVAVQVGAGALLAGLLTWLIDGHLGWPPGFFWLPFALSAALFGLQDVRCGAMRRRGERRVTF